MVTLINQGMETPSSSAAVMEDELGEFRGRLLEVSSFLTQFQSELLPPKSETLGIISPEDLEGALKYRDALHNFQQAQQSAFVLKQYGRNDPQLEAITSRMVRVGQNRLKERKASLAQFSDRTKTLHRILTRMEVWMTKLIAQDFLVAPQKLFDPQSASSSSPGKRHWQSSSSLPKGSCCFSCLLNLPCSKYFKARAPLIKSEDDEHGQDSNASSSAFRKSISSVDCCSLSLPPNRHTWEAYAKFSTMVALYLEGNTNEEELNRCNEEQQHQKLLQELLQSPACEHHLNRTRKHYNGKHPIYLETHNWQPADLFALWMRAQRNTQSMRHFHMLFEVEPYTDASGKRAFRAFLRGNPPMTKERVQDISSLVDQLVSWAVINQTMYTYPEIKRRLLTSFPRKTSLKRQRSGREQASPCLFSSKRFRPGDAPFFNGNFDPDDKQKRLLTLREACRSYLLRWFARRHRKALFPIYSENLEANFKLDIGARMNPRVRNQAEMLLECDVLTEHGNNLRATGEEMRNPMSFWPEDLTLQLVDSRLFQTSRYHLGPLRTATIGDEEVTTRITCKAQVLALCDSLMEACDDDKLAKHRLLVEAAKNDFIRLHDHYFPPDAAMDGSNEDEIYKLALSLMDPGTGLRTQVTNLLLQTPAPWPEQCGKCYSNKGPLKTCINCEKVYHEKCSTNGVQVRVNFKELIQSYAPMRSLFKLQKPTDLEKPDFSVAENIEWTEQEVVIKREIQADGCVPKLMMSMRHTEDCNALFEELESDTASVFSLEKEGHGNLCGEKVGLVAKFSDKLHGCLVTQVDQFGEGYKAGLRAGDVITRLEFVKCVSVEDQERYKNGSALIEMSALPVDARTDVLRVPCTECKMTVARPSSDIIDLGTTWYGALKRLNKPMLAIYQSTFDEMDFWLCDSCYKHPADTDRTSQGTCDEAEYCRAVLRRLGMEAYAEPFVEDSHPENSNTFCLRRLDTMLTHIMQCNDLNGSGSNSESSSDAFLTQPDANLARVRLSWVGENLENKPMELMCKAMGAMLNKPSSGSEDWKTLQSSLLRHFLLAFSCWCVGATGKHREFTTSGPPSYFRYACTPWVKPTCSVCFSRPCTGDTQTCNENLCIQYAASKSTRLEGTGDHDSETSIELFQEYSKAASFVGTTFLVLPNDPLVASVSRVVPVDHKNRPVEFIVASYLPCDLQEVAISGRKKDQYDQFEESDGIFHLLPVVSAYQQRFLLDRCKMRNSVHTSGSQWSQLDILGLVGVTRYSWSELKVRLEESKLIQTSMNFSMMQRFSSVPVIPLLDTSVQSVNETCERRDQLRLHESILRCLPTGSMSSTAIRSIFSTFTEKNNFNSDKENDLQALEQTLCSRKVFPGFTSIKPVEFSRYQILSPRMDPNQRCSLFYSDILFQGDGEKLRLESMLLPHRPLRRSSLLSPPIFCELVPPAPRGWGFEIVTLDDDEVTCLRIGRVLRCSHADRAGLKTHDIVEAVDGTIVLAFGDSHSEFLSSVRGFPGLRVKMPGRLSEERMSAVMSTLQTLNPSALTPVTLSIRRPLYRGDVSNAAGSSTRPQPIIIDTDTDSLQKWARDDLKTHAASRVVQQQRMSPNGDSMLGKHQEEQQILQNQGVNTAGHSMRDMQSLSQQKLQRPVLNTRNRENVVMNDAQSLTAHDTSIHIDVRSGELQGNVHNSAAIMADGQRSSDKLVSYIQKTANQRPRFREQDLYCPAGNGTVLTKLEVSIFLQAVFGGSVKYGVRLLMPRYDKQTVQAQLEIVTMKWKRRQVLSMPFLEDSCYRYVLERDLRRMNSTDSPETGEFVLKEEINGKIYQYREPHKPLPIDRYIESWWIKEKERHVNYQSRALQMTAHSNSYHERNHPLHFPQYSIGYQQGQTQYQQYGPSQNVATHQHAIPNSQNYHHNGYGIVNGSNPQDLQRNPSPQHHDALFGSLDGRILPMFGKSEDSFPSVQRNSVVQNGRNFTTAEEVIYLVDSGDEESPGETGTAFHDGTARIRGGTTVCPDNRSDTTCQPDQGDSEEQDDDLQLIGIPHTEWDGKMVFAVVGVQGDGVSSEENEDTMVGFVKMGSVEKDGAPPDTVHVDGWYLSKKGYVKEAFQIELDSDECYLMGGILDSELAEVQRKLLSEHCVQRNQSLAASLPPDTLSEQEGPIFLPVEDQPINASHDVETSDWTMEAEDAGVTSQIEAHAESNNPVQWDDATSENLDAEANIDTTASPKKDALAAKDLFLNDRATKFAEDLGPFKCLGTLPDGRDVFWFCSDRTALYLTHTVSEKAEVKSQKDYVQSLKEAKLVKHNAPPPLVTFPGCYHCSWGCSRVDSTIRKCLTFPSKEELRKHYSKVHSYGSGPSSISIQGFHKLVRIHSHRSIVKLGSGMTSAILARLPILEELAAESDAKNASESELEFSTSPTGTHLTIPLCAKKMEIMHQICTSNQPQSKNVTSLIKLWCNLAFLFNCDTAGLPRLTDDEFQRSFRLCTNYSSSNVVEKSSTPSVHSCQDKEEEDDSDASTVVYNGFCACSLCSLPFEEYFTVKNKGSGRNSKRSVGCVLLSDAAQIGKSNLSETSSLSEVGAPGHLGVAKKILLQIAFKIAHSVKVKVPSDESSSGFFDPLKSFRVFDEKKNYELWKSFVLEATNEMMLTQALVALLASIDRSKLPLWWSSEIAGWSTSQHLMTDTSLSLLYLRIYVLDAALTDISSSSLKGFRTAQGSLKGRNSPTKRNQRQNLDKYWNIALSQGLEQYTGNHHGECYTCDGKTGVLLQCSFCPNVQHRKCGILLSADDSNLNSWVCDSCLNDVEDAENEGDQENSIEEDEQTRMLVEELNL